MKKILSVLFVVCLLLGYVSAFAEAPAPTPMPEQGNKTKKNGSLVVDYTHMDQGYVMVKSQKGKKSLKVQVKSKDTTLTYDLNNNGEYEVLPLQYGSGKYTFVLYQHHAGKQYEEVGKITLKANIPDENSAFLYPNQYVDYTPETAAIIEAGKICSGCNTPAETWEAIKEYMKSNFMYDYMKASDIRNESGHLPQIDDAWNKHMGICQDLSAIMVAMLRSQGVPARLMVGTLGKEYHAWVSVEFDGKERWFDPTASLCGVKHSAKEYKIERYY